MAAGRIRGRFAYQTRPFTSKPPTAPEGARRKRRGKADWTNREARLPPQGVRCREAAPNQRLHLSERFNGTAIISHVS